jgi:hypothetical protein
LLDRTRRALFGGEFVNDRANIGFSFRRQLIKGTPAYPVFGNGVVLHEGAAAIVPEIITWLNA